MACSAQRPPPTGPYWLRAPGLASRGVATRASAAASPVLELHDIDKTKTRPGRRDGPALWSRQRLLLHAVGGRAPFGNGERDTRTEIALRDYARFRKAIAFLELTPPLHVRRSPFGNVPQ